MKRMIQRTTARALRRLQRRVLRPTPGAPPPAPTTRYALTATDLDTGETVAFAVSAERPLDGETAEALTALMRHARRAALSGEIEDEAITEPPRLTDSEASGLAEHQRASFAVGCGGSHAL